MKEQLDSWGFVSQVCQHVARLKQQFRGKRLTERQTAVMLTVLRELGEEMLMVTQGKELSPGEQAALKPLIKQIDEVFKRVHGETL